MQGLRVSRVRSHGLREFYRSSNVADELLTLGALAGAILRTANVLTRMTGLDIAVRNVLR